MNMRYHATRQRPRSYYVGILQEVSFGKANSTHFFLTKQVTCRDAIRHVLIHLVYIHVYLLVGFERSTVEEVLMYVSMG